MKYSLVLSFLGCLVMCSVAVAAPISAFATDQKDLSVGLKTLPLLQNKITGTTVTAIIFDPSNAASRSDADTIKAAIEANPSAPGGAILSPLMLPVGELSKLAQAKIAFVAAGVKPSFDRIAAAASSAGVLTISADLDCVKADVCILGVESSPVVEVYYSKVAADAARIGFAQAFVMLAKQI